MPASDLIREELAIQIGGVTIGPIGSFGILLVFGAVFLILSTVSFIRVDFSRMNRNKDDSMEF